jgi:DNA-binding response OmpR family regulator
MNANATINLTKASVLLLDDDQGLDVLAQILTGFGVQKLYKAGSSSQAQAIAQANEITLCLVDALVPDTDGFEFVRWLRGSNLQPNRYAPVLMVTGHTLASKVTEARDCGANFTVVKPVTPQVLLQRIMWAARDKRQFIDVTAYTGPDRRFKFTGPPPGTSGRRADDLNTSVGTAVEPNMSQAQIDTIMQPQKISI